MKFQTGVRIEADVWQGYRAVCSREKLRPSRPIEDFLRLVVDNDSVLSTLSMIRGAAKAKVEGTNAYARVLLQYFEHGKSWITDSDEKDISVEVKLLDALKTVNDNDLRSQIEHALVGRQVKSEAEKKANETDQNVGTA